MAQVLMHLEFKEYNYWRTYEYIMTENPVSYEGYYIDIIAVNKNTLSHLFEKVQPYRTVHDKLKKSFKISIIFLKILFY